MDIGEDRKAHEDGLADVRDAVEAERRNPHRGARAVQWCRVTNGHGTLHPPALAAFDALDLETDLLASVLRGAVVITARAQSLGEGVGAYIIRRAGVSRDLFELVSVETALAARLAHRERRAEEIARGQVRALKGAVDRDGSRGGEAVKHTSAPHCIRCGGLGAVLDGNELRACVCIEPVCIGCAFPVSRCLHTSECRTETVEAVRLMEAER